MRDRFTAISRPLLNVAALLVFATVGFITADVLLRAFTDTPLQGVPELVSLMIPTMVFLAVADLYWHNRFIRSELLAGFLTIKAPVFAAALTAAFHGVGAIICIAIAVPTSRDLIYAVTTHEFVGVETVLTFPVWPMKLVITAGAALLAFACLAGIFRTVAQTAPAPRARVIRWMLLCLLIVFGAFASVSMLTSPIATGFSCIALLLVFIYLGMPVAFALAVSGAMGIGALRHDFGIAMDSLGLIVSGSVSQYVFAAVPLFVLLGLVVGAAEIGRDSLHAAHWLLRKLRGGLAVATIAANALFAAITGISIASAAIFSRVAVPPLIEHGFTPRFSVGLVAGTSVLGMLIPPSLLLIIYGLVAEVSISRLFLAAIVPGMLLTAVFAIAVIAVAYLRPQFAVTESRNTKATTEISGRTALVNLIPVAILIAVVLGGIYGGVFTPTEAGAIGTVAASVLALSMRRVSLKTLLRLLNDAAGSASSILMLIIAASVFAMMLTLSGIPAWLSDLAAELEVGLAGYTLAYVAILIILGMVLDSTSILLIMVPLGIPTIEALGGDLIWFGIVTVVGVEIGLLTPPLGLSVYAIKASLEDQSISLNDIFIGALPFVGMMLAIVLALIAWPGLTNFG